MGGSDLDWTIESRPTAVVAGPVGRVDESTATAFGERLLAEIEAASANHKAWFVLSLAGVSYMSSRGLRGLTLAQRLGDERNVRIVLAEPNAIMREILAISRYDLIFQLFESVDAAAEGASEG
jgi:anti-sigma B factor antagonist